MDVKFTGLDNILSRVEDLADTKRAEMVVGKACAVVERGAKERIRDFTDTGELWNHIDSRVESIAGVIEGTVFSTTEYAPYVEYGTGLFAEEGGRKDVPWHYQDEEGEWHSTSGQKPKPFMRPALNNNREKIIRLIKEGISND